MFRGLGLRFVKVLLLLLTPRIVRVENGMGRWCGLLEPTVGGTLMAKKVMIVEDNELNMKLFRDLIEATGY